ncbi:MAG: galactose mutarotase [Clostridia bacterium]|nr:galactose mutarotase [Clostridia bacterium]
MSITRRLFGNMPDGRDVYLYTLKNASGASLSMINYGAIVQSIIVPDAEGNLGDVALGFDSLDKYLQGHGSMGDTIGRYGNRIGKGRFTLDGVTYQLNLNNGENHLHGGPENLSKKLWDVEEIEGNGMDSLVFSTFSPDGEENYPGNLNVRVTYSWDDDNNLTIRYQGTTDKPTLLNMTNHTYFNLAGHDFGTVREHYIYIDADVITPVDAGLIPTGSYLPVDGTPLAMTGDMSIGEGLDQMDTCPQMIPAGGYDHNYVLTKGCAMAECASVYEPTTGRMMNVLTDQPAVQLYTACTTNLSGGKGGAHYGNFSGFCLETQHCPDTPNNPQFPGTTVLRPGETYDTTTIYSFRVADTEEDDEE